ncbi:MAG: hypothetical protein ACOYLO_14495, partial [Ferruginibacter sp.]
NDDTFKRTLQSAGIPFVALGKVTAKNITVEGQDWGTIMNWKNTYDNAIGEILKNHESEEAMSAI